MSRINDKLGLKPAGKRSMMKLPADRAERTRVTSAVCLECGQRGVTASRVRYGWLFCTYCAHTWEPATEVGQ